MKKSRKVKCPECETFNHKEETIYHQKRYYCKICYNNKTKESQHYKDLISYICNLYEIEAPSGFILVQIKKFKEQFNYTYKGIELTLEYFYEIKTNNTPEAGQGLGIIPYVYEEAKQFFVDRKDIVKNIQGIDLQEVTNKTKVIHIKKSDRAKEDDYKDIAIINISEL